MDHKEHTLQLECICFFRNEYERKRTGVIIPVPNEYTYKNKNAVICKGASDLIVILPNSKTLFIELKTDIGKQSEKQIEFEKLVVNLGFEYFVIRTLKHFQDVITTNLK